MSRTLPSRLAAVSLSLCTVLAARPAEAGKSLPKDLAAHLAGLEAQFPGLTVAATETFLNSNFNADFSCEKAWSKSAKKAPSMEQLFAAYADSPCFREPLRGALRARSVAITAEHAEGLTACTATYPPAEVAVPEGRAPSDPTEAYAWAHAPLAALSEAIAASEDGARESWKQCAGAVNGARDAYAPLYAVIDGLDALSDGQIEQDPEWAGDCPKDARLDADISTPLKNPGKAAKSCHFGSQALDLAEQYQRSRAVQADLTTRARAVEESFQQALSKLVERCPTAEDEAYANLKNPAMEWEGTTIKAAVNWSKKVVQYCEPLGAYGEGLPDAFSQQVAPHADAVAAAKALADEIGAGLPALEEKRDEVVAKEYEAALALDEECEKLGDRAEALELNWKKCMSDSDLTSKARQYSATDEELYQAHMEGRAVSCAKSVGLATALSKFMNKCVTDGGCFDEYLEEIDPYEGDYGDLDACELLYPDGEY